MIIMIILCVWFREGGALAPSIGQPPLMAAFQAIFYALHSQTSL